MLVAEGIDGHSGLPYVDQLVDGLVHRRYLTALQPPVGHRLRSAPSFASATGIPTIPRADWPKYQFKRIHQDIPIIDQDGQGACVAYASTGAAMVLRARAGEPFVLLSAGFLYTLINGGMDQGANGADAADQMTKVGIAPDALVPGRPLRPAGVNSAALAAAKRFRLADAVPVTTIEEAVTAVVEGWQLLFDVQAGNRYDTDANGVIAYLGARTNHEQQAGEGFRIAADGSPEILGRNSWGEGWGGGGGLPGGFGWFTEWHFRASNTTLALKYMSADPEDDSLSPISAFG